MELLKKEGVLVDIFGRIYSLICTRCGGNALSETVTLDALMCHNCNGFGEFRVIRDRDLEKHLMLSSAERGDQWLS